jgi:hypothetical protein
MIKKLKKHKGSILFKAFFNFATKFNILIVMNKFFALTLPLFLVLEIASLSSCKLLGLKKDADGIAKDSTEKEFPAFPGPEIEKVKTQKDYVAKPDHFNNYTIEISRIDEDYLTVVVKFKGTLRFDLLWNGDVSTSGVPPKVKVYLKAFRKGKVEGEDKIEKIRFNIRELRQEKLYTKVNLVLNDGEVLLYDYLGLP